MKISIKTLLIATVIFGCSSCESAPNINISLVFEPDLSSSIAATARESCLDAIPVASAQLSRGDSFSVIPITGNAAGDAAGQTLRYRFGVDREPFDGDLDEIITSERIGLSRMTNGKHYERTDIFGTLVLAGEHFAHEPKDNVKALLILSDFLEDSGRINFMRDKRLKNPQQARQLAAAIPLLSIDLRGVTAYLGELPSVDRRKLSPSRGEAIQVFWIEYVRRLGARVEWDTDGIGEMKGFVDRLTASLPDRTASVATIVGADIGTLPKQAQAVGHDENPS